MTRYASIEEVNAALVDIEENERTNSTDKANNDKHLDSEKSSSRNSSKTILVNGRSSVNASENGGGHEEVGNSDSDSESSLVDPDRHDDEGLDEDNHNDGGDTDDDDEDGGRPDSDEDDEVHFRQKVVAVDPQEEADFEQQLKAVMQESLDSRRLEIRTRPTSHMMIPLSIFEGSTKDHHGRGNEGESGDETLEEEAGGSKAVQVKVLVKRGNKQLTKQMYIPRDSSLVQSTKQKEAAELEEKQDIKRLVLEYNDREEEELNGLTNQSTNWAQVGNSRVVNRGSTWEGTTGRGTGPRHRLQYYSGSGVYYSRRR